MRYRATRAYAVDAIYFKDDLLFCESVPLTSVAVSCNTPVYVYSSRAILDSCREIESAFGGEPHLTFYAVKANANRQILRLIAGTGLGADVGSRGELYLALEAGFAPEKITFSGVGKRDDEIAYALEKNILAYHVESLQELDVINHIAGSMGARARVFLRVNLDIDAGGHEYISTSRKQNKFGIPADRVRDVVSRAREMSHVELNGVHSHLGSQITDVEVFLRGARALAALVGELRGEGIAVPGLDFGGGFGVRQHGVVSHPSLPEDQTESGYLPAQEVIGKILPVLRETGCHLSIQPGRSIVAEAGTLLTKVLYRKETDGKTFVVVDGGMNDLIRPSLYNAHHQIVPLKIADDDHETVDVVGPVCESGDFFAQGRSLPRVLRGDHLAILSAGAYGYVLSSNYNSRLRASEVLVEGNSYRVIREREKLTDL
ncbi:MAG: diaminopimelate decarboxylase [Bacteroidota bacterium]